MTTGHPPPNPAALRAQLRRRLQYLDDLLRSGLDDYFSRDDDPEVRQAVRERIQYYIAQAERVLSSLPEEVPFSVQQVLMDVPVQVVDEETGAPESFTVVGPNEVDASAGMISFLSPLGSALLLKRVAETVELEAPGGRFTFRVAMIGAASQG
ncbi:MAG TPA: GreA/GreB family elongation factor [Symbiobacteriaceae bacterium]|jgi:transcription elongation GreA/GreB family factor|nr:GreA/GreB family elongation factor [Symbiobacteriaceae bacterium]